MVWNIKLKVNHPEWTKTKYGWWIEVEGNQKPPKLPWYKRWFGL